MHQLRLSPAHETSELILNAAGSIFAEQGFHATTVRQITKKAGVNVAAVNYHFGDKQELYYSVLKHAYQMAAKTAGADKPGPPEKRLHAFIHGFLGHLLDPQRPEWHRKLIARELAEPTPALDHLVRESVQPVRKRMGGILRELLGPDAPESSLRLACFSIIGQCVFYVHCQEMIVRLFPDEKNIRREIETLADHVFRFSLAALIAMKRDFQAKATRRPSKKQPKASL